MKTALVLGGGGFIGSHIVNKLKNEGYWVRAVDIKKPDFEPSKADNFVVGDLRDFRLVAMVMQTPEQKKTGNNTTNGFDEVYNLSADMGGAGYIFSGDNDANVMHNSALINLNVASSAVHYSVQSLFFSSSACIYPEHNQMDPLNPRCDEASAYPANPDSEYGWEKLFSERMYLSFKRNYDLNVHIGRYHNIYGPLGTYDGGKEKAPAALCRKIVLATDGGKIDIWGDGQQTRSFLYIDDCVDATLKLTRSTFAGPVNIGSEEMIGINDFAKMIIGISGKQLSINNIDGPRGVNGRKSDNQLINNELNWNPQISLKEGITRTYNWIKNRYN